MNVYPFIEAEKAGRRNVKRACALLKVSRAAFDAHGPGRPAASRRTLSSPGGSGRCTRSPRAATARRASMPSWPAAAVGTAVSASPG